MRNNKLKIEWIIPNILCYLMIIVFSIFVFRNADELKEINRFSVWIVALIFLFLISIFGSFRTWKWINIGKL
ncbi:hypothetical protein ABWK22_13135 [Gottfriedia acidiceleris]|uniref:hypothetical protein n=1 Tax=Gottfriedia acidiceleris TaxID=371036 RepID=UPI0033912BF7